MNEPEWEDSETSASELWKNPLIPMEDRLVIADGAIHFRDKVIRQLREKIKTLETSL